ncbi:MAG: YdcF family protein [Myxococcales bacterium]|nr:YdcF family protein [Myxococcales bacterium]
MVLQVVAVMGALAACAQTASARRRALGVFAVMALVGSLVLANNAHLIRKWLARLAMPTGWFFLILLGAAGWLWSQRRRREAAVATAVVALFALSGNVWLSQWLISVLEAGYRAPVEGDPPFDAVIVLGGGTSLTPDTRPQLASSGDRIAVAAQLYHMGLAPKILASGSAIPALHGYARSAGEDTRVLLRGMGVPGEAVEEIVGPKTTSEELAAIAQRASREGWTRVGLITSACHLPRAMRLAQRSHVDVVPIPSDFRGTHAMVNIVHLVPSQEGFSTLRLVMWETLARVMGQ